MPNACGETVSKPLGLTLGQVYNLSRLQLTRHSSSHCVLVTLEVGLGSSVAQQTLRISSLSRDWQAMASLVN